MAVADEFFMLSQSRDIEQWRNSASFIHEIVHAMQHRNECVRHSALQVVRRMRHALASLGTVSAAEIIASIQFESDKDQNLCCLQIIYTFALHHDATWTTDILQKHANILHLQPTEDLSFSAHSVYLLALLAIAEGDNKYDFRSSFEQKLRSEHLSNAWRPEAIGPLTANEPNPDAFDEVLPNFIAFTTRHQTDYGSARSQTCNYPELLLDYLQINRPHNPSVKLLQVMIPKLSPYEFDMEYESDTDSSDADSVD
ncbi:hypothetical protein BJ138DRAFT_1150130 [Hygrophoropsis aurantiaca]|uniref:Uncharacterized protein n=1 Tax=Hygrophoropsis aurantiaca TaxID=72124 RepID=A0ACB8AES4_9AGAM|nr:hypothetical protein BJ138DRAFT_1150130 [Hygrophoropsis aurantiaca]